jgi:hypothetical protein
MISFKLKIGFNIFGNIPLRIQKSEEYVRCLLFAQNITLLTSVLYLLSISSR